MCEKQRKTLPKRSWSAFNEYDNRAKKSVSWQRTVFRERMDTMNNLAQRGCYQFFSNVASETVYCDLFLFIRQKREKKIPPSASQLLFVFLLLEISSWKDHVWIFWPKQSAFQYKIKRAVFGKKKKKKNKRETSLYRVIRQEKRNEANLKAQVS